MLEAVTRELNMKSIVGKTVLFLSLTEEEPRSIDQQFSVLKLSYNLSCVECPDRHKNWWKFILAGFVPLTVFYLFILAFNINVTSSRLHGVVLYSQVISMPAFMRIVLFAFRVQDIKYLKAAKVGLVFYSLGILICFIYSFLIFA